MTPSEREAQTRKKRIDTKLTSTLSGWSLTQYRDEMSTDDLDGVAVEEYPTDSGPADYALFVEGKLLGFVEAKRVGVGAQGALSQAKRYSQTCPGGPGNWHGYRVPFLYSTNGEVIYHLDVRDSANISRQIRHFHTPAALHEQFERGVKPAKNLPPPAEHIGRLRPYQSAAIEATEEAVADGKRTFMVAMATGTGKTFLTVAQIYRLLESGVARRILFLVDRRALAAQAVRELSSFTTPNGLKFDQEYEVYSQRFRREDFGEDEPFDPKVLPNEYLTNPSDRQAFVYVCTIQRMTINLFGWKNALPQKGCDPDYEEDTSELDIPIHAFDMIIADECHRGYAAGESAIWRDVIDHFDGIKMGLTATPAAHTVAVFKEIVYRYTTNQAIEDGFLVDHDVVAIHSRVLMKGAFLKEGEQVGVVDTRTGVESYDELEDEREFAATEVEKKISVLDTNRRVIREIARYAKAHQDETGRFPKTLIFAVNDLPHTSHADRVVQLCKEEFGEGDDFVQKITGTVDRPLEKIRRFRNRPEPGVVVSVDMLTTGVDIPALEFIVFLRPVKSRILWVQMLGRGTRRCVDINKEKFVIFDCFGGSLVKYFKNTTDFVVEAPQKEPIPLEQVIENIYQNVDRDYNTGVLIRRLQRIDRTMSAEARQQFSRYVPDGDIGQFAAGLRQALKDDFTPTMSLLRDMKFQDLLINYKRAPRSFLVAYETQDEVTSAPMVSEERADDYLESFAKFIRENADKVEALTVLLNRPKEWDTEALTELRQQLSDNEFPEKRLRTAHGVVYHKDLADIISMVKHAASKEEPVLNVDERVDKALAKVFGGVELTEEQQKWVGYIRAHLEQNVTIGLDDFDVMPVFEQHGGKRRAERVFGEDLEELVEQINFAMAA